ncbi:hypothetical protein CR513_15441, partial [Mucuna pruriens]
MLVSPLVLTKLIEGILILYNYSLRDRKRPMPQDSPKSKDEILEDRKGIPNLVIVRTGLSIKQVLSKPDLVGRMLGWTVELSQVLADFIMELALTRKTSKFGKEWMLLKGSRAGVILKVPDGMMIEQSFRLNLEQATIKRRIRLFCPR